MGYEQLREYCISYFLTEFDVSSAPRTFDHWAQKALVGLVSNDEIDDFVLTGMARLKDELVAELEEREKADQLVRFKILDKKGVPERVAGNPKHDRFLKRFQDALHQLTDNEFEVFGAGLLRLLGCYRVYVTQQSYDQGLDAFGYANTAKVSKYLGTQFSTVYLLQAKHFGATKMGSGDVHQFMGAVTSAIDQVFSVVDANYPDLQIYPRSPVCMLIACTSAIPRTVRFLCRQLGIVVLGSDELYSVLVEKCKRVKKSTQQGMLQELRALGAGVQVARLSKTVN